MNFEFDTVELVILNSQRCDTGKYTIKLTNSVGEDTESCFVNVLSVPAKPQGPIDVKDITKWVYFCIRVFNRILSLFKLIWLLSKYFFQKNI